MSRLWLEVNYARGCCTTRAKLGLFHHWGGFLAVSCHVNAMSCRVMSCRRSDAFFEGLKTSQDLQTHVTGACTTLYQLRWVRERDESESIRGARRRT